MPRVLHITQHTFAGLEDALKTSSRHVLKTSSIRLQRNNFSSSRRLKDILKISWQTKKLFPWRRLEDMCWRRLEDVSWRRYEDMSGERFKDMSWRRYQDVMERNKYLLGISVSKKSKFVSSKSLFHKSISDEYKANIKYIN